MSVYSVSRAFTHYSDAELDAFVENVVAKMTDNPSFPSPPVPMPELKLAVDSFTAALADSAYGGRQVTAAKNEVRRSLINTMRSLANYVQGVSMHDLPVLLSSGFQATNTNRAPSPLPQPSIQKVVNEVSTQLLVRVAPISNARAYVLHYSDDGGSTWRNGITSIKARRIVVSDLTPGKVYTFQVQALGGSTGSSPWSDPVSHMAM